MEQARSSPEDLNWLEGLALWTLPARWVGYALLVEAVALLLSLATFTHQGVTDTELFWFGLLLLLGVGQAELSRRIESDRRRMSGTTHINMTSVWLIPAILLLPAKLVVLLCVGLYVHMWLRSWHNLRNVSLYRTVFAASAAILACLAASAVATAAGSALLVSGAGGSSLKVAIACLAGGVTFEIVDALLLAVSIYLRTSGEHTIGQLFGSWDDNALEFTTLCLGGLTTLALVYQPAFTVLLFCPIVVLHRSVLVKQLEAAATTDVKTGLLNAVTWHQIATQELNRGDQFGVLMVDLDHFKRVNDTYGHLAGDAVLKSVACAVKTQVRPGDSVGRFGGEEFVVLLPGVDEAGAALIAERIRKTVFGLRVITPVEGAVVAGLSCSIGVAAYPQWGTTMEQLLLAADTAVYRAKGAGRNRVVINSGHTRAA